MAASVGVKISKSEKYRETTNYIIVNIVVEENIEMGGTKNIVNIMTTFKLPYNTMGKPSSLGCVQ